MTAAPGPQQPDEELREAVLALHRPELTYTAETIHEDGSVTEEALMNTDGTLLYAPDARYCCSACGSPGRVEYPCPTVVAVTAS